jgi:hypothetical protein
VPITGLKTICICWLLGFAMFSTAAHARTFHYACSKGDDRYALTVNDSQRVVKLIRRSPTVPVATFKIQKVASVDVCAKYG